MTASAVGMHEIGHVLSVGRADHAPVEWHGVGLVDNGMEVYSGDVEDSRFEVDETPEYIQIAGLEVPEWSVMSRYSIDLRHVGNAIAEQPIYGFSIE